MAGIDLRYGGWFGVSGVMGNGIARVPKHGRAGDRGRVVFFRWNHFRGWVVCRRVHISFPRILNIDSVDGQARENRLPDSVELT